MCSAIRKPGLAVDRAATAAYPRVMDRIAIDPSQRGQRPSSTLARKNLVGRHLAEGLQDLADGKTHGPYAAADEAIAALEERAAKPVKKRGKRA